MLKVPSQRPALFVKGVSKPSTCAKAIWTPNMFSTWLIGMFERELKRKKLSHHVIKLPHLPPSNPEPSKTSLFTNLWGGGLDIESEVLTYGFDILWPSFCQVTLGKLTSALSEPLILIKLNITSALQGCLKTKWVKALSTREGTQQVLNKCVFTHLLIEVHWERGRKMPSWGCSGFSKTGLRFSPGKKW